MSKNHYIPQLWLRQFADGERINTFNVVEGRFETKKIKNTFYEDDIFPPELEEAFACKLEGPFGDLLNNSSAFAIALTVSKGIVSHWPFR